MRDISRSERVCRRALANGILTASKTGGGFGWRFGRRRFSAETVASLIANGEAVRIGNIVRAK